MTSGPGTPPVAPGPAPVPVRIRREAPGDEPAVRRVTLAASTGPEEAPGTPADGIVVGHLLLSPSPVLDDGADPGRPGIMTP